MLTNIQAGPSGFFIAWTLYFVLLCWVGWPRLCRAQLWAEDGKLFLAQALELGWRSVGVPYDGYLHTVPRLFALFWTKVFGVARYASAIAVFTYATLSAVAAMFVLPAYSWILPHVWLRFVVGMLMVFSPGLSEVLGNVANLHYVLFVGLCLFALAAPQQQIRVWHLVALALGCLTEGACWLLFLPFGLRLLVKRREKRAYRGEALALVTIGLSGCLHVAAYLIGLETGSAKIARPALMEILQGIYVLAGERLLVMPWALGDGVEKLRALGVHNEMLVVLAPLLLLLALTLAQFGSLRGLWLLSFPATFLLLLCMTFFVRPGTLELIVHGAVGYRARYAFASQFPACVLWVGAMRRLGKLPLGFGVLLLFCVQCLCGIKELPFRAFAPGGVSWRAALGASATYDEAGRRCIDIAPQGWRTCFFER